MLTNTKLINTKHNTQIKSDTVEMVKGEEIGMFDCCEGSVLFMINRPLEFSADIDLYKKYDRESFVTMNDVVAQIK